MTACTVCGSATDAFLCEPCGHELEIALGDLPALLAALVDRIIGDTRTYRASRLIPWQDEELAGLEEEHEWRMKSLPARLRTEDGRITLPATALPIDLDAAQLLADAGRTLDVWTQHLADARQVELALASEPLSGPVCAGHQHDMKPEGCGWHPDECKQLHPFHVHSMKPSGCGLDVNPATGETRCTQLHCHHESCTTIRRSEALDRRAAQTRWLLRHLDTARYDEAAAKIHADITRLAAKIGRAVDRSPADTYAGPCAHCGVDMWRRAGADQIIFDARYYVIGDDGQLATVRGCGMTYTLKDRTRWLLDAIRDELAPLEMLQAFVHSMGWPWPPAATVRAWRFRRRLDVRSIDRHGVELFRGGDVLDLLQEWATGRAETRTG